MSIAKFPVSLEAFTAAMLTVVFLFQPLGPPMFAQEAQASQLKITILEGEGAINNIRQRTAREPIVQVEDENRKPVAGALVVFTLPDTGPGGVFPGGSKSLMVTTDQKGQAVARGMQLNKVSGQFQIKVTATFKQLTAHAVISQSNVAAAAAAGGISGKFIAILAIAGAAAAAGIVVATREETTPPTVVSVGTPTVSRP
jgi:hypothetical protein